MRSSGRYHRQWHRALMSRIAGASSSLTPSIHRSVFASSLVPLMALPPRTRIGAASMAQGTTFTPGPVSRRGGSPDRRWREGPSDRPIEEDRRARLLQPIDLCRTIASAAHLARDRLDEIHLGDPLAEHRLIEAPAENPLIDRLQLAQREACRQEMHREGRVLDLVS